MFAMIMGKTELSVSKHFHKNEYLNNIGTFPDNCYLLTVYSVNSFLK